MATTDMNSDIVKNKSTYEDIDFGRDINVIPKELYPNSFPAHWHKDIELITVLKDDTIKGKPVIEIYNDSYELNAGDILIIWQGELHQTLSNGAHQLTGFQFSPIIIKETPDFDPFRGLLRNIHHLRYRDNPKLLDALHAYLAEIEDLNATKKSFYRIDKYINLLNFFKLLASSLVSGLNRASDAASISASSPAQTATKIWEACQYINNNLENDITLQSISDYFGFSTSYFSRTFKQVTGRNFVDYLMYERVKKAQSLLFDFDLPITEIAYSAGFKSISTFNRVFHQYNGYSPSEYRKYMV